MKAKTDKRLSYFISELKQIAGVPLCSYSRSVMPCETHRDAQCGVKARHSAPQHPAPAAGISCTAAPLPQPAPSEGLSQFVPGTNPPANSPKTQTALRANPAFGRAQQTAALSPQIHPDFHTMISCCLHTS